MLQRGFTLIEVLVASTIFVGIMVIGVSSFSSVNRVNEQIETTRNLSQTGNFVMEALVRDIRSATGFADIATQTAIHPFDFVTDPTLLTVSQSPNPSTTALTVRTCPASVQCSPLNLLTRTYHVAQGQGFVVESQGKSGSLLPSGIGMKTIAFSGTSQQSTSIQPFVTISFTLIDTSPGTKGQEQTFQTTVTSLVYTR